MIFRKNKLIIVSLIFFSFTLTSCAQDKETLRVLTYNIWDPADIPFIKNIATVIPPIELYSILLEDNADVLLLQEVTLEAPPHPQSFEKIRKQLIDKGYLHTAFYKPHKGIGYVPNSKNSGYPLAIFSKFPIEETYAIEKDNSINMGKGVLGIKIHFNKKPLFIFNTHLNVGTYVKNRQAVSTNDEISKVALPFINKIAGKNLVIFAGDFNSPSASEFPNSTKTFGDFTYSSETTQFILDANFKDTWTSLSKDQKKGDGVTTPGQQDYLKRVDQVYYRGNELTPTHAFAKHNLWEFIKLKDHNGVVVDFKVE